MIERETMNRHSIRFQAIDRLSMKGLPHLAICIWLASVSSAAAQQTGEVAASGESAKAISSILDDQTIAVVRIDASQLDVNNIAAWAGRVARANKDERAVIAGRTRRFNDWTDRFRKAGGRELYVILSFADFGEDGPILCVPRQGISDLGGINSLFIKDQSATPTSRLFPFAAQSSLERDGLVVFGSTNQLTRVRSQNRAGRELPK
jgi:hypothetical protein